MEIKHLKLTEIQTASNDSGAWACDMNTGICGPVSTEQTPTETIQIDFLTNKKESEDTK